MPRVEQRHIDAARVMLHPGAPEDQVTFCAQHFAHFEESLECPSDPDGPWAEGWGKRAHGLQPGEALCTCGLAYYYNSRQSCPNCGTSVAERVAIG